MRLLVAAGLLLTGQLLSQLLWAADSNKDSATVSESAAVVGDIMSSKEGAGPVEGHLLEYKICELWDLRKFRRGIHSVGLQVPPEATEGNF